jgi:hypothetical protein
MTIHKKYLFGAIAIAVLAIIAVAWATSNKGPSAETEVLHAAYPLYAQGIVWGQEVPLSVPPHVATNPTDQTIVGNLITSLQTATTTDVAAITEPLRTYYDKMLLGNGWSIKTAYQANGPGSAVWGYTKGNDVLIFSYTSTFLDQFVNQPVQCPCTVGFSILGGSLQ